MLHIIMSYNVKETAMRFTSFEPDTEEVLCFFSGESYVLDIIL